MILPAGKSHTRIQELEAEVKELRRLLDMQMRNRRERTQQTRTTKLVKTIKSSDDDPEYPEQPANTFRFVHLDQTFPPEPGVQEPTFKELSASAMDIGHSRSGYIPEGEIVFATWHPTSDGDETVLGLGQGGALLEQGGGMITLNEAVPGGVWWLQRIGNANWVGWVGDTAITAASGPKPNEPSPNIVPGEGTFDKYGLSDDGGRLVLKEESCPCKSWVYVDSPTNFFGRFFTDAFGTVWWDNAECAT